VTQLYQIFTINASSAPVRDECIWRWWKWLAGANIH